MNEIMEIVTFVRNFRNNQTISNKTNLSMIVELKSELGEEIYRENQLLFSQFLNINNTLSDNNSTISVTERLTTENAIYSICFRKEVHLEEEIKKCEEELNALEQEVLRCQKMLSNEGFLKKAPVFKINEEKEKLHKVLADMKLV